MIENKKINTLNIYNTLTRKIEEFVPHNDDMVTMYTCGPTVYHYAHIGNLRTYIFEDVLEKTLKYFGYNVKRCMNITDVGHLESDGDDGQDKMLKGAKRENKTVWEIADFYKKQFLEDIKNLNIKLPEIVSNATDNINEYIKIIKKLEEKGYTYVSNGNVYFDISKFENYSELSNKKLDDLKVAVRSDVDVDLSKRTPLDFVLWFTKSKFDKQEMKWDSPWGLGYPGWHIECSSIAIKFLGEYLDIHCGGVDNIFPHHTNEIAQSESYLGHKWCTYWCHGEHLNDKSGKMSKSKGEFLTLNLLNEKGYSPIIYRFFCLNSNYRNQLVFSYESMDIAKKSYEKLKNKIELIIGQENKGKVDELNVNRYDYDFKKALGNDLNTANALTVLYNVIGDTTLSVASKEVLIKKFDEVLSLNLMSNGKEEMVLVNGKKVVINSDKLTKDVKEVILSELNARLEAKSNKDFEKADIIRQKLENEYKVIVKDTREGVMLQDK